MSIATKKGDHGQTSLMYNRQVSKCHPRVEAYGAIDELNTALGMARATAKHPFVNDRLLVIQKDLVGLMGELATQVEDLDRYKKDGHPVVSPQTTTKLDDLVREIESQKVSFHGWATPGDNLNSATLDSARTICRRAERRVCALHEQNLLRNDEIIVYLNRLSDALWLLARWVETRLGAGAPPPRSPSNAPA